MIPMMRVLSDRLLLQYHNGRAQLQGITCCTSLVMSYDAPPKVVSSMHSGCSQGPYPTPQVLLVSCSQTAFSPPLFLGKKLRQEGLYLCGTEFLNDCLEQLVGYSQDTPLSGVQCIAVASLECGVWCVNCQTLNARVHCHTEEVYHFILGCTCTHPNPTIVHTALHGHPTHGVLAILR